MDISGILLFLLFFSSFFKMDSRFVSLFDNSFVDFFFLSEDFFFRHISFLLPLQTEGPKKTKRACQFRVLVTAHMHN